MECMNHESMILKIHLEVLYYLLCFSCRFELQNGSGESRAPLGDSGTPLQLPKCSSNLVHFDKMFSLKTPFFGTPM